MFNKVSYRRGVLEGVIVYTLGRLGALITPAFFSDWMFIIVPSLFLALMYILPAFWATRRMRSTKRERLSKRFWLLGPLLALICLAVDLLISLCCGLPMGLFDVQHGPALLLMSVPGPNYLSFLNFVGDETKSAAFLFAFFTMGVICTRLAGSKFLRFTMPTGENRVTL